MRPDFRRALPSYLSRHRSGVIPEHLPRRHWSRWEPKFGGSPTACLHAAGLDLRPPRAVPRLGRARDSGSCAPTAATAGC